MVDLELIVAQNINKTSDLFRAFSFIFFLWNKRNFHKIFCQYKCNHFIPLQLQINAALYIYIYKCSMTWQRNAWKLFFLSQELFMDIIQVHAHHSCIFLIEEKLNIEENITQSNFVISNLMGLFNSESKMHVLKK